MIQFGVCSASTRIIQHTLRIRSGDRLIMKPARMEVELHVMPGRGYPSRDATHRLIAEVSRLQSFDEKSSAHPELGETIKQEAEAMFLPVNLSQNYGFGDRVEFGVFKITTDTKLGIDGNAHLSARPCVHTLSTSCRRTPANAASRPSG